MKTLKKTLCLVLAMVMVFGLCSVSASAKLDSYKDKDKITYAEAVDVLSGIGILKGDASGFRPKDSITRAEAAKIMAYILVGDATQADSIKASTDPFPDVPATHWAAGYIAYCASAGIVGGKGDGYHPNENVTGLEFAKMLLCALGYGTKSNEYAGKDWAINTSKDAIRLGVFDDNLAGATTNPATREECALYAFNAIAKDRDPDGTHQYGLLKVTYSQLAGDYVANGAFSGFGGGSSSSSSVSVDANKKATFGADYKLKARASDEDAFERETGHEWYIDTGKKDAITAKYEGGRLKAVYTTAVTYGDIYALLGSDAINNTKTVPGEFKVYIDGKETTVANDKDYSKYTKGNTTEITGTGNGVETYVYQWWTESSNVQYSHVKICIVNTFLAKVNTVTAGTAKKDPRTTITLETVTANGTSPSSYPISAGYETEDFESGDYVLVTISNSTSTDKQGIQSMVAAPTIEDEITRYTMKAGKYSMVVDGTTYAYAANAADGTTIKSYTHVTNEIVDGDKHIVYLDSTGEYVMGIANVKESSNYVYVAQFGVKTNTDGKLTDKLALYADVYHADGTNEIVTVKTDSKAAADNVKTGVFKTPEDLDGAKKYNNATNLGVYVMKMDGSKAVLSRPDGSGANDKEAHNAAAGNNVVNQGNATIGSNVANSKTVFFYVYSTYDKDDFKVNVYTGINNVPVVKRDGNDTKALDCFTDKTKTTEIKAMTVESKISGGESSDTVYYYLGSEDDGHWDRYLKQVVFYVYDMNGVETEVTCDYDEVKDAKDNIAETMEPGFVKVTKGKLAYIVSHDDTSGGSDGNGYDATEAITVGDIQYIDEIKAAKLNEATVYDSGDNQFALKDAKIVELRDDPDPAVSDVTSWTNVFEANTTANKIAMAYKAKEDNNAVLVVFIIGEGA